MNLSETEADYIAEMFNVGLSEVAQRVASMIELEVQTSEPRVNMTDSIFAIAEQSTLASSCYGSFVSMTLTGQFQGQGILFIKEPHDRDFVNLVSAETITDLAEQDEVLGQLAEVLLEQYIVVMADLLGLVIENNAVSLTHCTVGEHCTKLQLSSQQCISITMHFTITDLNIDCYLIFINDHPENEFLASINAELQDLGLL